MANDGPPGGRYGGVPNDPWQPDRARYEGSNYDPYEEYEPPEPGYATRPTYRPPDRTYQAPAGCSDRTGDGIWDAEAAASGYRDRDGYPDVETDGHPGHRTDPASTPAAQGGAGPTGRRSPAALVITLVAVLVVVLCGGGVIGYKLLAKGTAAPVAGAASPAGATPGTGAPASPSYDPTSIVKGQCVVNDGDDQAPRLRVVTCGPDTYQVLARFDGTWDGTRCNQVAGATHKYFYDTTPDSQDFVLCLRKR